MSDKTEKQAITKAEVVKAMETIREWCESRDALEDCHDGCPMSLNCQWARVPDQWVVENER